MAATMFEKHTSLPPFKIFFPMVEYDDMLHDVDEIIQNQDFTVHQYSPMMPIQTIEVNSLEEFPDYADTPEYQTLETSSHKISENEDESGIALVRLLMQHDAMMESNDEDDDLSVMLDYDDLSFLDEFSDDTSDSDTSCASGESDNVSTTGATIKLGTVQTYHNIPKHIEFCDRPVSRNSVTSDSSATTDDDENYEKPYCKSRRGAKNILLWKFLLHQLDRRPDLLKWTNKRHGEFKFVDTSLISRLWGEQKRKRDMTFEKLSRGIRHYYKSGLMERIGGSRLVYKFNWKQVPTPFRKG